MTLDQLRLFVAAALQPDEEARLAMSITHSTDAQAELATLIDELPADQAEQLRGRISARYPALEEELASLEAVDGLLAAPVSEELDEARWRRIADPVFDRLAHGEVAEQSHGEPGCGAEQFGGGAGPDKGRECGPGTV